MTHDHIGKLRFNGQMTARNGANLLGNSINEWSRLIERVGLGNEQNGEGQISLTIEDLRTRNVANSMENNILTDGLI